MKKIPKKVSDYIKNLGYRVEWDTYLDDKWFGYDTKAAFLVTVSLITGEACVEVLAPVENFRVKL